MNKDKIKIGFIGAGYMGYGMALNLVNKYDLTVFAHKNRKPIDDLVQKGAKEAIDLEELASLSKVIIMCVTNTPVGLDVINNIVPHLQKKTTIIDITTHKADGSIKIFQKLSSLDISYVESPVMGGPVQAEEGVLGAIVGCEEKDFEFAKEILMNFCKDVIYFGPVGMGAKAKLVNNFLSLGTATFVIETLKAADKLGIDLKKLYDVAKLGSGNSGALNRMAEKAINNDYKGYIFSVNNTVKDLTYINELLKDMPNAEKLSSITRSFYEEAKAKGYGDLLISELIKK